VFDIIEDHEHGEALDEGVRVDPLEHAEEAVIGQAVPVHQPADPTPVVGHHAAAALVGLHVGVLVGEHAVDEAPHAVAAEDHGLDRGQVEDDRVLPGRGQLGVDRGVDARGRFRGKGGGQHPVTEDVHLGAGGGVVWEDGGLVHGGLGAGRPSTYRLSQVDGDRVGHGACLVLSPAAAYAAT